MFLVEAMADRSGCDVDRKTKFTGTLRTPINKEASCATTLEVWMCIQELEI
jgi:hypothetical protein